MAHDVFISYASPNKPIADAACAVLEARRVRCWIAPRDILPGHVYADALIHAISASRVLVLVFSAQADLSPHVMREVERAVSKGVVIVPLRVENVLPSGPMEFFLSSTHWLDAFIPPLEAHLAVLADTVERILGGELLAQSAGPLSAELLRLRLAEISQPHIDSVIEGGFRRESATQITGEETVAAPDDLFVAPPEAAELDAFLRSSQRGLIVAGESGAGKSRLLAHAYFRLVRAGGFAVFLIGRMLHSAHLIEVMNTEIAQRIAADLDVRGLDQYLQRSHQKLTLFVDGVNEHHGGGPMELLDSIVKLVLDEHLVENCQVLAACRTETWAQFRDLHGGRPLDTRVFHTWNGDAVVLRGFSDETARRSLYNKYRDHYNLRPARYDQLDPTVRELIRLPFVMALLAQAYGRSPGETVHREIPQALDYQSLFGELTARKAQDAERLLSPTDPARSALASAMEQCLLTFARVLYDALVEQTEAPEDPADGNPPLGAAVSMDRLRKNTAFAEHLSPLTPGSPLSAFDIVLQMGLIARVMVTEEDVFGNRRSMQAYTFFHDQYTQYWLGAVYQSSVLGRIAPAQLGRPEVVATLEEKITRLVQQSVRAPVLAGGVDHWVHINLKRAPRNEAIPWALANRLADSQLGSVRYYIGALLARMILRQVLPPDNLYPAAFRSGSRELRMAIADSYVDYWPALPPAALTVLMNSCDAEQDGDVVERLAQVLADHFDHAPAEVLTYLTRASQKVSLTNFASLASSNSPLRRQLNLVLRFCTEVGLAQFEHPQRMGQLRDFAVARYGLLIEGMTGTRRRFDVINNLAKDAAQKALSAELEKAGIATWRQAIAAHAGSRNDQFFVDCDNVCQRDVLFEYFPYLVALHNGEQATTSLVSGSPFRQLVRDMLNYRPASVIGYVAATSISTLLRTDWNGTEGLIADLVAADTESARFFVSLVVVNLAYTDSGSSASLLNLLETKILEWVLAQPYVRSDGATGRSIDAFDNGLAGVGVLTTVLDQAGPDVWPKCRALILRILSSFAERGDPVEIDAFGRELPKVCFFPEPTMGLRLLNLMIEEGYLERPLWRECVLRVMAGVLARRPSALDDVIAEHGLSETLIREARSYVTRETLELRDQILRQAHWNRLIAVSFASNVTLRCLLVKILIGGFVQSNSVEEYAREFRRFTVQVVQAYLGDTRDDAQFAHIGVEEALAAAESCRIPGGGKAWQE